MHGADFSDRPMVVVWEMTRACRLACRHCRAEARPDCDPDEICGAEVPVLLDRIAEAGPRLLILTGGDPSRRGDILGVIGAARDRGLRVAFSPSATPDLLALDFGALKEAGVWRASLSLDAATREEHDRFRGVKRAWDWTMRAMAAFGEAGIPVQINTTVTAHNIGSFRDMAETVRGLNPAGWTIFLVVPTGRAAADELPGAPEVEAFFEWLCEYSRTVPFEIRTTEGQHFRRVLLQKDARGEAPAATNGAKGFVFVSHTGDICPSGFLPLVAGNVRRDNLLETYRHAPVFEKLRDPSLLKGKCGRCGFNRICGGSRARAYGLTGDVFAEEPLCAYQP
jgi:AdoMet-dependent heme synthase